MLRSFDLLVGVLFALFVALDSLLTLLLHIGLLFELLLSVRLHLFLALELLCEHLLHLFALRLRVELLLFKDSFPVFFLLIADLLDVIVALLVRRGVFSSRVTVIVMPVRNVGRLRVAGPSSVRCLCEREATLGDLLR